MNGESFDLFRLTNSKKSVDICHVTLMKWFKEGLPFYKRGKAVFVSKTELAHFIRFGRQKNNPACVLDSDEA